MATKKYKKYTELHDKVLKRMNVSADEQDYSGQVVWFESMGREYNVVNEDGWFIEEIQFEEA